MSSFASFFGFGSPAPAPAPAPAPKNGATAPSFSGAANNVEKGPKNAGLGSPYNARIPVKIEVVTKGGKRRHQSRKQNKKQSRKQSRKQ